MKNWIKMLLIGAVLAGCKKPYDPPAIASFNNYLVVEGVVNSGTDSTIIKLSRTVNLGTKSTINPELLALVTVESDQGKSYTLKGDKKGNYFAAGLNLDATRQYRLRIQTNDNKTYLSDFVPVLNSPPIDSVNFVAAPDKLNIFANTHDGTGKIHYYRWDYKETWIFHSNYESQYKSNGDTVLGRDLANDEIYTCWGNDTSSTILLGSSAKLKSDILSASPITSIPSSSEKIGIEYSIIVRQYALSSDAYAFYTNLKTNTEDLGSIFDAQPSQLKSNIHSVDNPAEPVIGYLSVGSTTSQRVFIRKPQIPYYVTTPAIQGCQVHDECFYCTVDGEKVPEHYEDKFYNYNKALEFLLIPIDVYGPQGMPIGHSGSTPICVDCTLRGTNKQPAFWVY